MTQISRILLWTLLLAVGVLGFVGVVPLGLAGPVVLIVPVAVVGLGISLFRGGVGGALELRWGATTAPADASARARANAAPVATQRPTATRRQIAGALGWAEARQWVGSPWFAVGVGFCVLMTALFGWVFGGNSDGAGMSWRSWFVTFPIMAHPMVGMAVVGAHSAVTRARRDRCEELFAACPIGESTRTAAHLRCAWVPAAVLAAFVVATTLLHSLRTDRSYGPIDARALADVLAAVVLGVCGVWLGVALGRWAPWRLAPVVFVAALVPVIVGLGSVGDPHWSNARQLSTWPRFPPHDLLFTAPPVWWHLVWIAALGAAVAVVAMAHADRGHRTVVAGLVVAVVVAGAGFAETRPLSGATAARIASLVAESARHQTCRSSDRVTVCVYRGYEGYLDDALGATAPVGAATPSSVGNFTLRQHFNGDVDVLGPEVARRIGERASDDEPYLSLGFGTADNDRVVMRLETALHAVGLPARASAGSVPMVISGQARGVVALWLASRGLDAPAAQRLASHHYNPDDDTPDRTPTALDLGMAWPRPDACDLESSPVAWARQDLQGARSLLAMPADDVHELLLDGWSRFTDPATTTNELLVAAGLDPVGMTDRVVAIPLTCSY